MTDNQRNLLTFSILQLESICSEIAKDILDIESVASTFETIAQPSVDLLASRLNLYFVALFKVDSVNRFLEFRAGSGEYGKEIIEHGHKLEINSNLNVPISASFTKNGICLDGFDSKLFFEGFFFSQVSNDVRNKDVQAFRFIEALKYESPLLPHTGLRLFFPLRSSGKVIGVLELQTSSSDIKSDSVSTSLSDWGYRIAKPLLIIADQVASSCAKFER